MNRRIKQLTKLLTATSIVASISVIAATATAQSAPAASETTIPGGTLVIVAYIGLWVLFGGALFAAIWRQRHLQRELDGLEERIDRMLGTDSNLKSE